MTMNITRMAIDIGSIIYIANKLQDALITNDTDEIEDLAFDLKIETDSLFRETQEVKE